MDCVRIFFGKSEREEEGQVDGSLTHCDCEKGLTLFIALER